MGGPPFYAYKVLGIVPFLGAMYKLLIEDIPALVM